MEDNFSNNHHPQKFQVNLQDTAQKYYSILETIWTAFYDSQNTSNLIAGLKIPKEPVVNLPSTNDIYTLPYEAQLILSQCFKIIDIGNRDIELGQSNNLIQALPEFIQNLSNYQKVVQQYAVEYKKFDIHDFNELYKVLLSQQTAFSLSEDNLKFQEKMLNDESTLNVEDILDAEQYLNKIQKLQTDITDCNNVLWRVMENFVKILSPIVPHITEELWQYIPKKYQYRDEEIENLYPDLNTEFSSIMISPYPNRLHNRFMLNKTLESNFADLHQILDGVERQIQYFKENDVQFLAQQVKNQEIQAEHEDFDLDPEDQRYASEKPKNFKNSDDLNLRLSIKISDPDGYDFLKKTKIYMKALNQNLGHVEVELVENLPELLEANHSQNEFSPVALGKTFMIDGIHLCLEKIELDEHATGVI